MSIDYSKLPANQVRRRDREQNDEQWIIDFLHRSAMGVVALLLDDQPFINSNLFAYHQAGQAIYMHTARTGRTRSTAEQNERVCFSSFEMGRLLPAPTAKEFSVEYAGVTAFGRMYIVEDEEEKESGLQLLMDKYFAHLHPGTDYRPITAEELKLTSVYRIDIDSWSGKRKQVEQDFPGAFFYRPAAAEGGKVQPVR